LIEQYSLSGIVSDEIADRFWLLTDVVNSDGTSNFTFSSADFVRYTARFRSDTFYIVSTYCAERGGFYSIENSTLTVTQPMLTGVIFDCAPLPELTSFNDTSSTTVFPFLIDIFNFGTFTIEYYDEILQLTASNNNVLKFRECITDCFVQI